jgi:peptidyl-prolyl cis-trans isomerase C
VTRKAQADYVAKLREGAKIERMDQAANTPGPLPDAAKPDAKASDTKASDTKAPDAAKDSKMAPAKK